MFFVIRDAFLRVSDQNSVSQLICTLSNQVMVNKVVYMMLLQVSMFTCEQVSHSNFVRTRSLDLKK